MKFLHVDKTKQNISFTLYAIYHEQRCLSSAIQALKTFNRKSLKQAHVISEQTFMI